MLCYMERLAKPFRAYTERVSIILKHVAVNEVFDDAIIIVLYGIHRGVRFYSQVICMFFYLFQFLFAESTGIYNDTMHLISFILSKVFYTIGCVQSAAKSEYYFF